MPRIDHARVESGELGDQKLNVLAASVYTPYERDETPQASDRCRNQVWVPRSYGICSLDLLQLPSSVLQQCDEMGTSALLPILYA